MPRPARAREPSRASPRRAAARTRTGCAAPRPLRSAGAAVQRGRPRLRRAAARASQSGPASGPAIGGAAAARAVDRRRRRPRSRVCLRCQRAWPRRAIPAARAATTRRGGCPGTRATASRMAIASMITRIGRGQTSVSATKLAALAPRHRRPAIAENSPRSAPAAGEGRRSERGAWGHDPSGSPGMGESVAIKREAGAAPARPPRGGG